MHCQRLGALPSFRLRGVNEGGGSAHALGGIGKWSTHVPPLSHARIAHALGLASGMHMHGTCMQLIELR